ncbi:MAG: Ppx/GppA family phosphatase [bacterium]|nr:Ppx/GppA family phosphatase [Bacteroidales bacterium]MDO4209206.1 Ppx/GppA family phosphatase [bacterium]MDY3355531.1 Ppx/GppA family phosphatase [Prevotella sp.]MDY3743398.1 Ppx/GppA family phosphatase [Prevotella sp.]
MQNNNYAAIDIGSNGARLLIKNVKEDSMGNVEFTKVLFLRIPLRLGKDVFSIGEISDERERMMMCMTKSYKQLMRLYNVEMYRACATSAMRDARNGKRILKRIKKKTGIDIEILNGSEEAKILYNNSLEAADCINGNYAYVDVGGGSTEISLLSNGELVGSCSYNIGTLRMLSGAVAPDTVANMRSDLEAYAEKYPNIVIVGSGGNINKLSRLFHESSKKAKKNILPVSSLQRLHDDMKPMTINERIAKYGLKTDRADVIIPAAEIFMTVAQALGCSEIHVPNISLADGIIDGLYKKSKG